MVLQVPENDPARKDLRTGLVARSILRWMGLTTLAKARRLLLESEEG